MLTKKDLESKFNLSANTVYKTLQCCSLDTSSKQYSDEEINEYFVAARKMLDAGKTYSDVEEYFGTKSSSGAREVRQDEEFNAEGFAANQATDATDAVGIAVAETMADMVESSVKQVAPYVPALVMSAINQELNSGEIRQAFDHMRSQIKSKGNGNGSSSGAAFLLQKMRGRQENPQLTGTQEYKQLPEASQEVSTESSEN